MKEVAEEQDFVKDITKMSDDFDRWYTDVVRKAELADWSGVRGMMVIRPYGWSMWEAIQRVFDDMIKASGHENWAFPLLIPREYLMKEAEHVEGFAPEVAWVTRAGAGNEELEEPLAVRPTSETIVGSLIRRYIHSHRDLPKLTNQWNNVVRWEMRSRLFLRTREFFWQEGHTFHASAQEAMDEVDMILGYYREIAEDWLAVPVLTGSSAYAVTGALGGRYGFNQKPGRAKLFYGVIIVSTFVGVLLNFVGINPIRALFLAAMINGFLAPPLLVVIMLVASNRQIMGDRVNSRWSNLLGWTTTVVMFVAAVALVLTWGQ